MAAIISISVFWSFCFFVLFFSQQGNTYCKDIQMPRFSCCRWAAWLSTWNGAFLCMHVFECVREKIMSGLGFFQIWNGIIYFKKPYLCARTAFSILAFVLTSNHFTLAQGNFKWLKGRLPQNFCDTSSSRKFSSSEEKGEVSIRKMAEYQWVPQVNKDLSLKADSGYGEDAFIR